MALPGCLSGSGPLIVIIALLLSLTTVTNHLRSRDISPEALRQESKPSDQAHLVLPVPRTQHSPVYGRQEVVAADIQAKPSGTENRHPHTLATETAPMPATNVTAEHRTAFEALTNGDNHNFALFSRFLIEKPAAAIVAVTAHQPDDKDGETEFHIKPLFVSIVDRLVRECGRLGGIRCPVLA